MTPSVKRTPTTESLVELENERRAMYRTVVGKWLYTCQERADIMYSVKETARNISCPTDSDEMSKCKVPDRNRYTSKVRERVHKQRLGRPMQQRAKAQAAELCSGETQHSQHGHEHSRQ